MVDIVPKGLQLLGIGSLVNAASSFIETGPADDLISADVYSKFLPSGDGGDGSSQRRDSDDDDRSSPITEETLRRSSDTQQILSAENIWNVLVCGESPSTPESRNQLGRRMDMSALWQRASDCNAEDVAQLLTFEDGQLTLDREELNRRLDRLLGPAKENLTDDKRQMMVAAIATALGADPRTTSVIVDGSETLLDSDNYEDARSFTEMLKRITSDDELAETLDMGTQFGMLDSMINEAVRLGIPQAIDHLLEEYQDDQMRCKLLLNNVETAAQNSELSPIEKTVDRCGGDAIIDRYPQIINTILRSYYIPSHVERGEYPDLRTRLIDLLDSIDERWHERRFTYTDSDDEEHTDWVKYLGPYASASEDALELLKGDDDHFVSSLIAEDYQETSLRLLIQKYYPEVVLD